MSHTNAQIAGMFKPVRCNRCRNGIYDIGTVTVTARYTDCSMWKTPCCNQLVDDRGETGWKSLQDYEVIDKGRVRPDDPTPFGERVDRYGLIWRG